MSSTFPTSLDTIPDAPVAPALGGSTPKHSEMHDLLRDAIVALEVTVGTTADPKLARLDGVAGGQTLIGGTADTDALVLKSGLTGARTQITITEDAIAIGANAPPSGDVLTPVSGSLQNAAIRTYVFNDDDGIASRVIGNYQEFEYRINGALVGNGKGAVNMFFVFVTEDEGVLNNGNASLINTYGFMKITGTKSRYNCWSSFNVCQYAGGVGGTASYIAAVEGRAEHIGLGTVSNVNSLCAASKVSGGGTATTVWGTEGVISVSGNSTVISALSVGAKITNASGSTITNAYGVQIAGPNDVWSNAGTITNCYALYIGSGSNVGTNKWSIYNQSPAVSYFAGSLAIGVTAASAKIHAIATTEQLRLGYDAANYCSSTTDSTGKTTTTAVGTAPNLKWLMSDATTNAIYDLVTFSKNSSSAGAAGLGVRVNLAAKSSTTADTLVGAIDASWVDATHASRKGRVKINAYDTAIRECIRAEASGTAAMLGFFGVTAVVRPTALTTQLTTLTYTAPSVADYAIQNLTSTGGFGFVTADEGNSVLAVIKNLQDRVAQLETKLQSLGLLT